jgi:hypothetical protein
MFLKIKGNPKYLYALLDDETQVGGGLREIQPTSSTGQIAAKLNRLLLDHRLPLQCTTLVPDLRYPRIFFHLS